MRSMCCTKYIIDKNITNRSKVFRKCFSIFVSSTRKRVFSRRITSPLFIALQQLSHYHQQPYHQQQISLLLPNSSDNLFCSRCRVKKTYRVLWLCLDESKELLSAIINKLLIVGRAAAKRVSSVILSPSNGTLKIHICKVLSCH